MVVTIDYSSLLSFYVYKSVYEAQFDDLILQLKWSFWKKNFTDLDEIIRPQSKMFGKKTNDLLIAQHTCDYFTDSNVDLIT